MQIWSTESYTRNAAFVPALGAGVLDLLAPKPDERILDLGCGEGTLTQSLVAAGARVVGVDASPDFIASARTRGLDARLADAHDLPFDGEFDAVFSNAALHWMLEPERVLAGVARALVPGGRFVAELGAKGNVTSILQAIEAALERRGIDTSGRVLWYFPSSAEYATQLEAAGFVVERLEYFARPTRLPTGMRAWLETFAQPLLEGFGGSERDGLLDEVTASLAPALRDAEGSWVADYVRLRFVARL
jgi:trans-aconitate methyltransferase